MIVHLETEMDLNIFLIFSAGFYICQGGRLGDEERVNFIHSIMEWRMLGDPQHCTVYNFGFPSQLRSLQLSLSVGGDVNHDLGTFGLQTDSSCSFVTIFGDYLDQLDDVMNDVDNIVDETKSVPHAVFLIPRDNFQVVSVNTTLRDNYSPTLVMKMIYNLLYHFKSMIGNSSSFKDGERYFVLQHDLFWS